MKAGFTLIETLIALAVTAVAVVTFQFGLQALNTQAQQHYTERLAWYHMLAQLESDQYDFTLGDMGVQHAYLIPHTDKKRQYGIYESKGKIIMTTEKGGYMPLITGLHYAEFQKTHGHLKINVITGTYQHLSAVTTIGEE